MAEPEAEAKYEVQSATIRATANSSSSVLRQSPVEITLLPLTSGISSESRPLVTDSSSHTTTSSTIPSTAHTTSSSLRSTSNAASSSLHTASSAISSVAEAAFSSIPSYSSPVLQTTSSLSAFRATSTGNLPVIESTFSSSATSSPAQLEEGTTGISSILPQSFTVVQVVTSGSVHTLVTVTLPGPGSVTMSTSTVSVTATPNIHSTTHPSLSIPIAISFGGFVCLFCILLLAIRLRHHSRSSQTDIEPLAVAEAEDSNGSLDQGLDDMSTSRQVIDIFEALDYSSHISSTGEIQSLRQQLDQLNDRVEQMRFQGAHNSIFVEHGDNQTWNGGRTNTVQLPDPDPDPDATPPPTYTAGHISLTDTLAPDENTISSVALHITPYPMQEGKGGYEDPF